ncbi:SWIM-type domain-containing protein [Abeliophyllum distichum]|uniref:SWIM-type domain-containing protein n=1 Tax=Abeliophyllum distichum TaxID=126358 RepID=A0ABD1RW85_9LAMI
MRRFVESVKKDCASNASKWKYYRTRTKCLEIVRGNSKEQFQILLDYCDQLKKSNVGSTIVLKTMIAGEPQLVLTVRMQCTPIAYAVVEVENKSSWNWFLELSVDDIGVGDSQWWTLLVINKRA